MKHGICSVRTLLSGVAAASLILVGACASQVTESEGGGGDGETIRFAVNPWPSSHTNGEVAKAIMEQELDMNVELVEIDQTAQWPGLASGEIDAALEVWVESGQREEMKPYLDKGSIEDVGDLGVTGIIGWYVPTYVIEDYPQMKTWKGLKGNAQIFDTAETSGSKGQFLAADPSFTQRDKSIIKNLDLDLEVVQSGSEAAQLTAVESAIKNEKPVLFYFYEPHWAFQKWDLSMVRLPKYTDACGDLPASDRKCGYPEDVLQKVVNADLKEKSPKAYEFIKNFKMTNDWQNKLTYAINEQDISPAEASKRWVDEHEDVWRKWLP